jgi:mono/diheme cytochrome c family protein
VPILTFLPPLLAFALCAAASGVALAADKAPSDTSDLDVPQLFATTCGYCHGSGGREAGKGPQLMDTKRNDDFIRNRIKTGKAGAMPAFGVMFNDADIDRIIGYIRGLRPEE